MQKPNLDIECSIELPEESSAFESKETATAGEPKEPETSVETETKEPETQEPLPVEPQTEMKEEETQEKQSFSAPQKSKDSGEPIETTHEQKSVKKIKITQPVEQFVGSELEIYGPYKEEDIAEVPTEIAEILIGKGSAEKVE